METREMTCICCPLGCSLTATKEISGEITVTGNTCPRGEEYARTEWLDPRRVVTTTVVVTGQKEGEEAMVSVKTKEPIPKDKIREVIGTGGKVIREIIEKTGAKVDIDDDGNVTLAHNGYYKPIPLEEVKN